MQRPKGIETGSNDTFDHIHGHRDHDRDRKYCHKQWDQTRRRDRLGGFHTVAYDIVAARQMAVDRHPFQLLSVALKCDVGETPWCDPDCKSVGKGCDRACDPIREEDDIRPDVALML